MSWSTIDADTSWQSLTIAQEIATAYNKRADACGVAHITADSAVTVFDFILAAQTGIETMAVSFGSPSDALTGRTTLPANWGTVAAMMTAAGLTATGYWRRIAEGGSCPVPWTNYTASGWSYGKITDKDLAGPWLFKDLQVALTVLTRIYGFGATPVAETYSEQTSGTDSPVSEDVPALTGTVSRSITDVSTFTTGTALYGEMCTLSGGPEAYLDYIAARYSLHMLHLPCGLGVSGVTTTRRIIGLMDASSNDPFAAITGLTSGNYKQTYIGVVDSFDGTGIDGWLWKNPGTASTNWSDVIGCLARPGYGIRASIQLVYGSSYSVTDYAFNP